MVNNYELGLLVITFLFVIIPTIIKSYNEDKFNEEVRIDNICRIVFDTDDLTVKQLSIYKTMEDENEDKDNPVLPHSGVYILSNRTKGLHYVKQSVNMITAVNAHFTGDGNKDIYQHYIKGDEFTIKLLYLSKVEYKSASSLERDMIAHYNSYKKGYNTKRSDRIGED